MRPIRLTLQAFGSYGEKQTIDFTKPAQNLFLITGDTGAGKSTIFDGIAYALYGEAASSANKKDGIELHSHFASADKEPFVELEFEEGPDTYVVRREPRHFKVMKNGKLKANAESEKVCLTMPDGSEYPSKETDKKLVDLVGLTKAQFMQVAMIAQGEFMQVLRENSNTKKEVFRKLFGTEIYKKIIDELENRKKEKYKQIEKLKTGSVSEILYIEIPEYASNYEKMVDYKNQIRSDSNSFAGVMDELLKELDIMCADIEVQLSIAKKKSEEAEERYAEKQRIFGEADQLKKRFDDLEKARQELLKCSQQEKEILDIEKRIKLIKKAYDLKVVYDKWDGQLKQLEKENTALLVEQEKLPDLTKQNEKTKTMAEKAEADKAKADSEYALVQGRVNDALSSFEKINGLDIKLKKLDEEILNANIAFEKAKEEQERINREEISNREKETELKNAEMDLKNWEVKKKELDKLEADYSDALEKLNQFEAQKKKHEIDKENYLQKQSSYETIRDEYNLKEKIYFDSQAGVLAQHLIEGEACPVCGSLNHPSPCKIDQNVTAVSKEALELLGKDRDKANEEFSKALSKAESTYAVLKEKEGNYESAFADLRSKVEAIQKSSLHEEITLNELESCISDMILSHKKQHDVLKKNADLLIETREWLSNVTNLRAELKTNYDKAQGDLNKLSEECAGKKAERDSLSAGLGYENKAAAEAELSRVSQNQKIAEKNNETAQNDHKKAKTEFDTCNANIDNITKRIPELEKQTEQAASVYMDALNASGMSEDEWKFMTETYSKDTEPDEKRIKDFRDEQTKNKALFESASKDTAGHEVPDTDAIAKELEIFERNKKAASDEKNKAKNILDVNKKVLSNLSKSMEKHGKEMEHYGRLENLYNRFAGKQTGSKMDIETYVQRRFLERILYAANIRFLAMTAGQFEFRMYDINKAGEGKNRGLDLMIYSNITGKENEVRMLSGGESFMAALALALGMADEIQMKSSAINLDIMFIDEGFGSLDDHSRSEAIKVLKAMACGSKLIGIISHVTELKQEIDDLLVVSKNENGSHAKWINS